VVLGLLVVSVVWVYRDATRQVQRGRRVVVVLGRFRLEDPVAWATACLLGWILFFPLYLTARD
jgi:hypothetical protein